MTNKTNNQNLITMMVLGKYHENTVSTVLKPHVSMDGTFQIIGDLFDYCIAKRECLNFMMSWYGKHDNHKKYWEYSKDWDRYYNLTHAMHYYLGYDTDGKKSLSYRIITNTLLKI